MRSVEDIKRDIEEAKQAKKLAKKEFGKASHEWVEVKQDLDDLRDELDFELLHAE